ncbi:hypothetical protein [Qipengyuania vesicularis]|uniref:hypothetical protein n=1 Tax=Qipengyuania vesicularis TaxID=2867232 RepID=UPI001C87AB7A|nr:hypothetical protein [Qipengyuania vesicularis]MBX7526351.1 hypothetical protein [Qipengyuania vesicularis]
MSLGSFAHKMARFNRGYGRIFIPIWLAFVGFFTIAAVADSILEFGWGYDWSDVKIGLIMFGCGIAFWFVWQGGLRLSEWFNETMFGPDPTKNDD